MKAGVLLVFGICCIGGTMIDMFSSIFGLIALAKADYWVARIIVGGLAFVMTMAVAGTKSVLEGRAPPILAFLWVICVFSDLVTNTISFTHFVVANGTMESAVVISPRQILELVKAKPNQGVIAAVGMVAVSACTIGVLYCLDPKKQVPPQI